MLVSGVSNTYLFILIVIALPAIVMVISPRMFLRVIRMKKEYNSFIRNSIRFLGLIIVIIILSILL